MPNHQTRRSVPELVSEVFDLAAGAGMLIFTLAPFALPALALAALAAVALLIPCWVASCWLGRSCWRGVGGGRAIACRPLPTCPGRQRRNEDATASERRIRRPPGRQAPGRARSSDLGVARSAGE